MSHKHSFRDIKAFIKSKPPIKLAGVNREELQDKDFKIFLEHFFTNYNRSIDSVYANGTRQTKRGTRRTMLDIYRLVLYYFPETRLTAVYKHIIKLIGEKKACSAICSDLNARVYRGQTDSYSNVGFLNSALTDEYGVDFTLFDLKDCAINKGGWGSDYTEDDISFIQL